MEHYDRLDDETQANVERYIVDVICDSFVTPADEDYVTARLLAQKGMHRAFFWAASQALEKYLKAFLLMRGVSVKDFAGHPVYDLYVEACKLDGKLSTIDTTTHSAIKIHPNVIRTIEVLSAAEFIKKINSEGHPENRYNASGVRFNWGNLFALDSLISVLRQQIGVPSIDETLRKMDRELVEKFYRYNPWFAPEPHKLPELPNESFCLRTAIFATTLDFLTGGHAPHEAQYALQWLDKKMKLPSKVRRELRRVK